MIEILPPLEKYKYDTWRILLLKCYIDNSMRLRSCIRNVNTEAIVAAGPNGSYNGGPGVAWTDARGAPNVTPDPKVAGKRPAATMGSGGSSPPDKHFHNAWRYGTHFFCRFPLFPSCTLHRLPDPYLHALG
jgi:hypothetical protein